MDIVAKGKIITKRLISFWIIVGCLCLFIQYVHTQAAETLHSGTPVHTSLPSRTYRNYCIDVPFTAIRLTVTITNGTGDLDLYLKYGSPLSGGTIGELAAEADIKSDDPTALESIEITPSTVPALQEGKWYVVPLNLNNTATDFTLTATVEVGTKHQLDMTISPKVATPGASLSWTLEITSGSISGNVDLYAAVSQPQGPLIFLGPQGFTEQVVPYQRGISIEEKNNYPLLDMILPSWLVQGEYTFYAVLVSTLRSPFDTNNWVSNLAISKFYFSLLSPAQQAFVSEMGYPQQFMKTFSDDNGKKRVDEVWTYVRQGLSESFVNGVFVSETELASNFPDFPSSRYHPENYNFDITLQDVLARHGQPLNIQQEVIDDMTVQYYIYDGITFGFVNKKLVSVMVLK